MPERITKAQAEAALERIVSAAESDDNWFWHRDGKQVEALRAYLAQRPDEETVSDEDERETIWRLAGADVDKMIDAIREVCAEAKARVAETPNPEEEA